LHGCQIFPGTKYQNVKNITNDHKVYQNGHEIHQIALKMPNGFKMHQHFPFHGLQKYAKILTFRTYANTPSGNPGQLWTNR
jgi:hypothetical protein